MKTLLTLLLCLTTYSSNIEEYHVDMLEYNTFYDASGCPSFSQFIYWRFEPGINKYIVAQWNIDKVNWKEGDEEHRDAWIKEYRDMCDKFPHAYSWGDAERKYKGKFDPTPPFNFPQKDYNTGLYKMIITGPIMRTIFTKNFIETHTQHDPETNNKIILDEKERVKYFDKDTHSFEDNYDTP